MGWETRTGSDIAHVIKKEVLACAPGAGALPAPAARASTALRDSSACVRCGGAPDERPAFGPGAELWAHGGIEGQVMSISHPAGGICVHMCVCVQHKARWARDPDPAAAAASSHRP